MTYSLRRVRTVRTATAAATIALLFTSVLHAADESITVHADRTIDTYAPFLTGACIEDVNHEVYGGIYSQMIFGESFQEPAESPAIPGFKAFGGEWSARDGQLTIDGRDGPKLIAEKPSLGDGSVSVDLMFADAGGENAGLIVRTSDARVGADAFTAYEISLDAGKHAVRLARHRNDYTLLRDVPCDVAVGKWTTLKVELRGSTITIFVDGKQILSFDDGNDALRDAGQVGLRAWNKSASFRNLKIDAGHSEQVIPITPAPEAKQISQIWRPIEPGSAKAAFSLSTDKPFVGRQSQTITFVSGEGEVGLFNRSLNGWGMHFEAGRPYEGVLWVRAEQATPLIVAMESSDVTKTYATQTIDVPAGDWQRITVALTPDQTDRNGQFSLKLNRHGFVTIRYAFLQRGAWGRFNHLPVRKDIVDALQTQGVSILRYGGSMILDREYRWKNMTGPRDRRPPTTGWWYRHSSNGWAIPDFLNLCDAINIVGIPDLNVDESPGDIAHFIDYALGSADTAGGAQRIADGHPKPYDLKYIQLGNEESVNETYADKFIKLADTIWKKHPELILVVGDFAYNDEITDPDHLTGTAGQIKNMNGHRKILSFAKSRGGEVWFDVHTWSEKPEISKDLAALPSYVDALDKISDGAKHRVVVFELNANTHDLARGLANAVSINRIRRDGRLPIVTSANCLQPDKQNDNGWDQGLIFLNPSAVWFQPAAYVTQMQAHSRQPILVHADAPKSSELDVTASTSADQTTLVVEVVNFGEAKTVDLTFDGFKPTKPTASLNQMAGPLDAKNTADAPTQIVPHESNITVEAGQQHLTIPAHSFGIYRFE